MKLSWINTNKKTELIEMFVFQVSKKKRQKMYKEVVDIDLPAAPYCVCMWKKINLVRISGEFEYMILKLYAAFFLTFIGKIFNIVRGTRYHLKCFDNSPTYTAIHRMNGFSLFSYLALRLCPKNCLAGSSCCSRLNTVQNAEI